MSGFRDAWVINNKTDECWKIDEDSSKPIYLLDGFPKYDPVRMLEYRLSNHPSERYQLEHPAADQSDQIEGQMSIFDFLGEENDT